MASDQDRKLFVGGLHISTNTDSLKSYFSQFGEVTDAVVMTNPQTNKSKCFGFITFGSADAVDKIQSNRPHTIDGKTVDTKRAIPKEDPSPESRVACQKIFIGGLRKNVTGEELRNYFSQFGNITDCQLVMDKVTGISRGFGFVTYEDTDSVDKVILNKPHQIGDSKADVKKALSKEEMANVNARKAPYQGGGGGYGQSNMYGGGQGGWGGYGQGGPQQAAPAWDGYGAGGYAQAGYGGMPQQQMGGYPPAQQAGGWGAPPQQGGWGQQPVGGYGDASAAGYQTSGGPMKQQPSTGGNRPGPY